MIQFLFPFMLCVEYLYYTIYGLDQQGTKYIYAYNIQFYTKLHYTISQRYIIISNTCSIEQHDIIAFCHIIPYLVAHPDNNVASI